MHAALLAFVPLLAVSPLAAQIPPPVPFPVPDPGVITTGQKITPAGVSTVFTGSIYGLAYGDSGEVWVAGGTQLHRIDTRANRTTTVSSTGLRVGMWGLHLDPVTRQPLLPTVLSGRDSRGNADPVHLQSWADRFNPVVREVGNVTAGSPGLSAVKNAAGERLALVPLPRDNATAITDLESGRVLVRLRTGNVPAAAVIDRAGLFGYVSSWGGRVLRPGDLTAYSIVVDPRGAAATGAVYRIDLTRRQVVDTIEVELHPTALALDEANNRLYVANSNSDSISVIDTTTQQVAATWRIEPFDGKPYGALPSALALASNGRLYVACAGLNAVAVLSTQDGSFLGLIPTGWYPTTLALSPDQSTLAAGAFLGIGSGILPSVQTKYSLARRGLVSLIPIPTDAALADFTSAAAENTGLKLTAQPPRDCPPADPIPYCAGDPSPIEHVVLIIKENRTYDQVFSDLGRGNADRRLLQFGWRSTPNHHRLAEQFVNFDNFYATGGLSAEGHLWLTQGIAPTYVYWPGYTGRSYPFDGSDPLAYSPKGFIWDLARRFDRSVRVYGEMVPNRAPVAGQRARLIAEWLDSDAAGGTADFTQRFVARPTIEGLKPLVVPNFPAYDLSVPDVVRAEIFKADLARWEAEGTGMPHLTILQLPSDHTLGTNPGESTPDAMVADNDLALGRIMEALSRSRFWPKMAVFVTEDDSQGGFDHVDGHRTISLVASPYARRGALDSTFYSHQSILKTIELILGLPTLTIFDLIANDMRAAFQPEPDFTPYESVRPEVAIEARNPPLNALKGRARRDAIASARMKWHTPDAVPFAKLNRIVWAYTHGQGKPLPPEARRKPAALLPVIVEAEEDEDEDEDKR